MRVCTCVGVHVLSAGCCWDTGIGVFEDETVVRVGSDFRFHTYAAESEFPRAKGFFDECDVNASAAVSVCLLRGLTHTHRHTCV